MFYVQFCNNNIKIVSDIFSFDYARLSVVCIDSEVKKNETRKVVTIHKHC